MKSHMFPQVVLFKNDGVFGDTGESYVQDFQFALVFCPDFRYQSLDNLDYKGFGTNLDGVRDDARMTGAYG